MVEIYNNMKEAQKGTKNNNEQEALLQSSLSKIKFKFIVMSGKGGVGKTSTALNLAISLADQEYKVGIIDIDLHGPDIPRMLGLEEKLTVSDNNKLLPIKYSNNLSVVSVESIMPSKDDAIIWRGPMKYSAIQQFIGSVEWGNLDFLIIDAPPGTGDEPLTIAQTIQDAKAIIVTTPQEVALADVRKSINFCKTVNLNIFGLIENMSELVCEHCKKPLDFLGSGGGEKTAIDMKIPFLGKIPFDPNMVSCGDKGIAYQKKFKNTIISETFREISKKITDLID